MALFVIADLHLAKSVRNKTMNIFGGGENYMELLEQNWKELVSDEDTIVLPGDISWAMKMKDAYEDFKFIEELPGRKIILKGNHDYWWASKKKMEDTFEEWGFSTLHILHNNCFFYGDVALCGTRGWFFEEETGTPHDKKIMLREIGRLETSLKGAGEREKLVFLHYPPLYQKYECPEILALLREYGVKLCCYGHIHGKGCRLAFNGWRGATEYRLVSADAVDFTPVKIL